LLPTVVLFNPSIKEKRNNPGCQQSSVGPQRYFATGEVGPAANRLVFASCALRQAFKTHSSSAGSASFTFYSFA
jgi:hypothetical protein